MQRARRTTALILTALLSTASVVLTASPAAAVDVPSRSNGSSNTLFLVHGFDPSGEKPGTDCASYWSSARTHFKNKGWRGGIVTFGYYAGGSNCTYKYNGDRDTSITTIAKALANRIYTGYSRHGRKVDVVAHSMGGLVVRSALYHTHRGTEGFPPYLFVEDVVTLGTPHDGANSAELAACKVAYDKHRQCTQMTAGSQFLKDLPETPSKSAMGTDWTVVSSFDDNTVSEGSGLGVNAQHKIQYDERGADAINHSELKSLRSGSYRGRVRNSGAWSLWAEREAPLERARQAVALHATK
ncbi:hypothetical protein [Kribbella sp. NPDC051770]|uniref:esterase/lipase family protein n=1 Tax=Kribbella sp. NPDC051770 TaxID=3155413 RepID=UPI00343AAEEB